MYKITIYERKDYPNGGQVLLDTSSGTNPGVMTAKCECTLNEAGSCTFGLAQIHPLYDSIKPLQTYVSVEDEGNEIFFGRVIMVQKNKLTGQKTVTCEGALAFLMDIEMDADSSETTYTAQNYFIHCLSVFNSQIANDGICNADPARRLDAGNVTVPGKNENGKYKNGSRTQVQSVMKSRLLGNYDGFFNVRRSGTAHYLDWVTQVGTTNPQRIKITENVTSHSATESGEDMFTKVWPKGNNDIQLSPIAISNDLVRDCGVIIKTVNFDADSTSELQSKVNDYIVKLQDRLSINGEIGFVDFHYLDGTIPKVKLGDVFTGIDGYEGTKFTAAKISRDLLNPATDKLSLKTDKDLMTTAGSNGANSGSSGSGGASGSGSRRGVSGGGAHMYKYIHEGIDRLDLATKEISITATEKFSLIGQQIEIMGTNISTISADQQTMSQTVSGLQGEWRTYKGTAIYQNRDRIAQVAGKFSVSNSGDVLLEDGAEFVITQNGTSTNVGQLTKVIENRVYGLNQWVQEYEGSYSYQHDDEIGGLVGLYTIEKLTDPTFDEYTVPQGGNPKALGLYEKDNQNNYVPTNDETAVSGKKYYHLEDIDHVTFNSGGGYRIRHNGVEYGVYDAKTLTGGVLVDKLNDGSTTTQIKGSRVIIGDALTDEDLSTWAQSAADGTGVFAKFLTVQTLTAQKINTALMNADLADIGSIEVGELTVSSTLDAGSVSAGEYWVTASDGQGGHEYVQLRPSKIANITKNAAGSTLTITYNDGTSPITFSKATTITGAWSSGTLTVQTDLASIQPYIRTLARGASENSDGTPYTSGNSWYIPINAEWGSSGQYTESTGWRVFVNAANVETAGKNAVTLNNPTWNAITGATPDHRTVTVTTSGRPTQLSKSVDLYLTQNANWTNNKKNVYLRTSSTIGNIYAQIEVDAGSIYTQGVTDGEGEFSLASVTLQGSSHPVTPISGTALRLGSAINVTPISSTSVRLGSAGTYYTTGSAATYYKGNGGSFTVQGSAFTKLKSYGNTLLYYKSGSNYYSTGHNTSWYYYDDNGTQYYRAGTTTKISRGDSVSVTPIGTQYTCRPIVSSGGTEYYTAGTAETYMPVLGSGGTAYYQAGSQIDLYNAGSTVTDTYYTKS